MTQEDKDLLLKDLCARLPYNVWVSYKTKHDDIERAIILNGNYVRDIMEGTSSWIDFKPYLRPMSSMTDEEKKEFIEYAGYEIEESVNGRHYEYYLKDFCGTPDNPSANADGVDWLNKKMFDFRGLIPKDLALSTEIYNLYVEN